MKMAVAFTCDPMQTALAVTCDCTQAFGELLAHLLKLCWACMAAVPGLHHRLLGRLLPAPPASASAAAGGGSADAARLSASATLPLVGSSSSCDGSGSGLPPYDVASLRAEQLLALAFEQHDTPERLRFQPGGAGAARGRGPSAGRGR